MASAARASNARPASASRLRACGCVSFKVSDIAYEVLTDSGHARPAPYLARAKWVNLETLDAWPDDELADHLTTAHAIVAGKLTRKARKELRLD